MPTTSGSQTTVEVGRDAQRAMRRLPPDLNRRLIEAMEALAGNPRPNGCKKLAGRQNHYRIRVGDRRISYAIYDDRLLILVVEISPRGGAYRNL